MEFLFEYGLFFAKAATIVIAVAIIVGLVAGAAIKQKPEKGQLDFKSISNQLDDVTDYAREMVLGKADLKKLAKAQKKEQKEKAKSQESLPRLFVIDFNGSMDANEVDHLREEVTAILCIANEKDEVLVKIESGGGVVHGYGLGASQLQRIKDKNIPLVAAVDKVAASGGYMMACVADKVLAAPYAIIGSIGVIAQLPNFNKLLKNNHIEFEQHTAGNFKRTLTVFGENTDEGREKFREELGEVHEMFKHHVGSNRQDVDIDKVATGEHWYGQQAKTLALVDEITTSDDYLMQSNESRDIFAVKYSLKKSVAEKFGIASATVLEKTLMRVWSKTSTWFK